MVSWGGLDGVQMCIYPLLALELCCISPQPKPKKKIWWLVFMALVATSLLYSQLYITMNPIRVYIGTKGVVLAPHRLYNIIGPLEPLLIIKHIHPV